MGAGAGAGAGRGRGAARAPAPPRLRSDVPGTWAHDTMSRRVREEILGAQVLAPHAAQLGPAQAARLEGLGRELAEHAALRHLEADGGADLEDWRAIMEPHVAAGETWLTAPWIVAEFYLYRRILEALRYFGDGQNEGGGFLGDPFAAQKAAGLEAARDAVEALAGRLGAAGLAGGAGPPGGEWGPLQALAVLTALWGNRMDLSLWQVGESGDSASGRRASGALAEGREMLLADDSAAVLAAIAGAQAAGGRRMDLVVDNSGFELVTDLCLAEVLLASGAASRVVLHMKAHPTFVSDAMERDLWQHLESLEAGGAGGHPASAAMAARWRALLEAGSLEPREDFFWAQPTPFQDMPERIRRDLAGSALVFVKGDANYRRLLDERAWPLDTPFADVASGWPAPVCALRTLKAELGCGMPPEACARARAEDPDWLVSGRYGVLQFRPAP